MPKLERIGFLIGFRPHTSGLESFSELANQTPDEIVAFLRASPDRFSELLNHSYDKRFTPSTFLEEVSGGYRVGWFHRERKRVRSFSRPEDAGADYLLFSFGRGRLAVPDR